MTEKEILHNTHGGMSLALWVAQDHFDPSTNFMHGEYRMRLSSNPFYDCRQSLLFYNENGICRFQDLLTPTFNGDIFDFVSKYFGLDRSTTVDYLQTEYPCSSENEEDIRSFSVPQFSYYSYPIQNVTPLLSLKIEEVYHLIKSESLKQPTLTLRNLELKKERDRFKSTQLPYVTFSGTFNKRSNEHFVQTSNYIVLDIDEIDNPELLKEVLVEDMELNTILIFTSPSGQGIKWVVEMDPSLGSHTEYFTGIENYVRSAYGISIDPSGKDIARACFLCYDPDPFINPDLLVFP